MPWRVRLNDLLGVIVDVGRVGLVGVIAVVAVLAEREEFKGKLSPHMVVRSVMCKHCRTLQATFAHVVGTPKNLVSDRRPLG